MQFCYRWTVVMNMESDDVGNITLEARDLYNDEEQTWNLLQFHFHWDAVDTAGSENRLDGEQFPMEVRAVILLVYVSV